MAIRLYRLEIRGANNNPKDVDRWEAVCSSEEEFVLALRASSFAESTDAKDYMEGFAERAYKLHSHFIRTSSYEDFVQDLVAVGYLTLLEVN